MIAPTEAISVPHQGLTLPQMQEILRRMLRIRLFDERASGIRAASIPGFLHNSTGQEAAIVGACMALQDDDYMTGNHRSHGHPIAKGAATAPLMAELLGKRTGVCRGKGGSMHLAVFGVGSLGESGIVGASMPAATGAALGAQLRGTKQVCLSFFGDGAANCGPFHESLNLAAVWKLPVIFFCENNAYAGCTSQMQVTAVADIATRASAYGIPGVTVDGQDVLAVYEIVSESVTRAREGGGPTLVEAKTYRYCDHLEADSACVPYRSEEEVAAWRAKDPIELFTSEMRRTATMTRHDMEAIRAEVERELDAAVTFAQGSAPPEASELLQDVFV